MVFLKHSEHNNHLNKQSLCTLTLCKPIKIDIYADYKQRHCRHHHNQLWQWQWYRCGAGVLTWNLFWNLGVVHGVSVQFEHLISYSVTWNTMTFLGCWSSSRAEFGRGWSATQVKAWWGHYSQHHHGKTAVLSKICQLPWISLPAKTLSLICDEVWLRWVYSLLAQVIDWYSLSARSYAWWNGRT